jgi:RNA polymerase sigma-70 factor (ECF subfamily)
MKGERQGHVLQATALVHEVYLRLIDAQNVHWTSRVHFFAICAQMMRRILVDAARKRMTSKRGGGLGRIDLDESLDLTDQKDTRLIALNDALDD